MKRRSLRIRVAAVLFCAGLCVMLAPSAGWSMYESGVADMKQSFSVYAESGDTADDDAAMRQEQRLNRLWDRLNRENRSLYASGQTKLKDAFSYEQPGVDLSAYGIGDDCIGFITVSSIDVELPIYLGANTDNMKKGAAQLTGTSYPIGGENTNCVIAAHRGTKLVMFRDIDKIKIGDDVVVENFRETLLYRAVETKIIKPSDVNEIMIQPGRDLVTLISCNPLGHNYERYVVYCERVKD